MITITEIIQLITLIIIGIGAIIALKQIRDQHEWYRREKALSYSSLYHPEIQEIKKILNENFAIGSIEDPIPIEEIKEKLKENKELNICLSHFLNYYENISLAYFYNLADEDVLFNLISGSLIDSRKKLKNYIDFRREQAKNRELYINLERLSQRWERMKEHETEKPPLGKFNIINIFFDVIHKTRRWERSLDPRWPVKGKSASEPEPSKAGKILDTIGKVVSIVSALAIIVFIILLWLGQTSLASIKITNLLTIVSTTLVGGIGSIGGGRIFSFEANLRRMQQIVQSQTGCPFVPLHLGSDRRSNGDKRPGNPEFCLRCPLGIDISSSQPDGLIHNCRVYTELHQWLNNR